MPPTLTEAGSFCGHISCPWVWSVQRPLPTRAGPPACSDVGSPCLCGLPDANAVKSLTHSFTHSFREHLLCTSPGGTKARPGPCPAALADLRGHGIEQNCTPTEARALGSEPGGGGPPAALPVRPHPQGEEPSAPGEQAEGTAGANAPRRGEAGRAGERGGERLWVRAGACRGGGGFVKGKGCVFITRAGRSHPSAPFLLFCFCFSFFGGDGAMIRFTM